MIEELSKAVFMYLVLNFLCNSIFLSKMLRDIFWYISLYVWRVDFCVCIFLTIFFYLCVLEAIWVLFRTMKGIIWKFLVYFTLVIFNITPFFRWKWGTFGPLSLNSTSYPQKSPGMSYTVGFEILSRLWISNFHFPKLTWQVLIML